MADATRLVELGMPPELAKEVAAQISGVIATVPWANVSGAQAGVEAAVSAKTEIAALTGGSNAAAIVTALQA